MALILNDVRFAVRSLVRNPGFAAVAVVILALGIGANTAVFSVVNGALLRPLPYPDPDRVVMVWTVNQERGWNRAGMSRPDVESVRELAAVESVEGFAPNTFTLTNPDGAEPVQGAYVSGGILQVFGLAPTLGRDLRHEENDPRTAERVVLVSHNLWRRQLGGDPNVLGARLMISDESYEIVGVAPAGFDFPPGAELWTPHRHPCYSARGCRNLEAVARLSEGVDPTQAQASLTALASALREAYADTNSRTGMRFERLLDYVVANVRTGLWILLGAVGLLLLVVCANVANLLLARASARSVEVGVRAALGASRSRLLGQFLVESLLLAVIGGVGGLTLSLWLVDVFKNTVSSSFPRIEAVAIDGSVLLFCFGLTALVAVLFGLSPALHATRRPIAETVAGAGRGSSGRRESAARTWLLVGEVALSVVLLVGAGLLGRSLGQLYRADMGFSNRDVLRFELYLPSSRYGDPEAIMALFGELEDRTAALPGVTSVGSAFGPPLTGIGTAGNIDIEGRPAPDPSERTYANVHPATPGYFRTLGLSLLRGRGIEAADREDAIPVAVVNEAFVRENFPGQEVLGSRIQVAVAFGYGKSWTVVGVVRDVRRYPDAEPQPEVYVPLAQAGAEGPYQTRDVRRFLARMTVHARGPADAGSLFPGIRAELAAIDPNVIPQTVETVYDAIRRAAAPTRHYLALLGLFAFLAIALASVGLYGVVAYLVSRRTREIGIRMAFGAGTRQIAATILRQGIVPAAWGIFLGLVGAVLAGRVISSLLFNVAPTDLRVYVGVALLTLAVSVTAILLPTLRATRVDPVEALRDE
ncbi:MAG: ABC transporter permease [Gemmatimonadota bacterium]|nr:MAG: ABC transporter permease [Gemmatimonadota bacterium]